MQDTPENNSNNQQAPELKDRLVSAPRNGNDVDARYSSIVRRMRLILPVIALIITGIVFTWSNMDDSRIVPVVETPQTAQPTIGKNELLNPRFESRDRKNQPFTITANRAIQGEKDEELIILEEPVGDMLLDSGSWVAMTAEQGAYKQDNQNLLMRGSVRIFHDAGYQMTTDQLHMDMKDSTAFTESDVYAQGPKGVLNAKGMEANAKSGQLSFKGPAKLVLYQDNDDKSLGGLVP